jgi:hypothetical protein
VTSSKKKKKQMEGRRTCNILRRGISVLKWDDYLVR